MSEIETNLSLCIEEKIAKIAKYRFKYPEWWLVLADRIGYGLDDFERELFLEQVKISNSAFDRIVLLDPRDGKRAFEVWPSRAV